MKTALESTAQGSAAISAMVREATVQAETYTAAANEADDGFMGGELGEMQYVQGTAPSEVLQAQTDFADDNEEEPEDDES